MNKTFQVINRMAEEGIIRQYAVAGAVAAINYIEPTLTDDLDILISIDEQASRPGSGLMLLEPIFAYLRKAGYTSFKKEGIVVEGWPVQFLPVATDLDAEGLAEAVEIEIEADASAPPIKVRTLRAEHLVATALRVGRPKDHVRITQFLEADAVNLATLKKVLDRHNLRQAWAKFCTRVGIPDPIA
ncbi:MAG: hypothetical protein ACREQI_10350 [Candidatus Binataceae bacterium]